MLLVLAVSGVIGFRLGMVAFPEWQVAVETAQVLAGVVRYPTVTPFFVYHAKLWTLLHQVLALFLHAGVSEMRLSLLVSGLLGMISLQAVSMVVYALSRSSVLSIGASLVIVYTRATEFGAVYPIYLMGASHTYGIIGLSMCVLAAALLGAGGYRTGAFLLGLTPAIHPSLGFWLLIVVAASLVWERNLRASPILSAWKFFVAGSLVTGISLALHVALSPSVPSIDSGVAARYLSFFVEFWDAHRQPISLNSPEAWLNGAALTLALTWLVVFSEDLSRESLFLLRIIAVSAALSFALVMLSWIEPQHLPGLLLVLMPTRLLNFNAMIFVPLLFGLVGKYRATGWGSVLTLLLTMGLLVSDRSRLWSWLEHSKGRIPALTGIDIWLVLETVAVALIVVALGTWSARTANERTWRTANLAFAFVCLALAVAGWRERAPRQNIFADRTNSPVFRVAAETDGLLLTGGNLHLIQLRTRRPVLIDGGGLDGLPYALDSAPQTEQILRDIYGIDYFHPPDEARRGGVIPSRFTQIVWEQLSPERWKAIRDAYSVTQVMTYANWSLHLPVVAQDRDLRLYAIPD